MPPGEDGHSCVTRWHPTSAETASIWQDSATRVLWSFTCKHSTQLTTKTAQGTTGPTITECTTQILSYTRKDRLFPIISCLPTYPHHLMLMYYITATSKSGEALFCGLHLEHRCSLSITTTASLLIRWKKKWVSATPLFNAGFVRKLQTAPTTMINTG